MKKIGLVFSLVLFLSVSFQVNAQWEIQNPCSIKFQFNSVIFIDTLIGWAASDYGIILKTTNGGIDWIELSTDTEHHLRSIYFSDKDTGWAAGDEGTILRTSDGGETWKKSTIGTNINLHQIQFIDKHNGWVCGSGGNILYTINGGLTWNFGYTGTNYSINSICFVSRTKGWAVLSYSPAPYVAVSQILYSTDGGLNWAIQAQYLDGQMFSIYFLNETTGWVVGSKVYRTFNGYTWQVQTSIAQINSIHFIDSQNGWAVGNDGQIKHTNDGGNNWTNQINYTDNRMMSCIFINYYQGWTVGRNGIILSTADGGNYWKNQTNYFKFALLASFFLDQNNGWVCGWAVGQKGPILRTTNSGKNWEVQTILDHSVRSISFLDSLLGFVVSADNGVGRIYKSSNGGKNWEVIWSENESYPVKIQFIGNNGWVLDENKKMLHSNDKGSNWVKDTLDFYDYSLYNFQFVDSLLGWIVGYSGIYKTTNGGRNWIQQTSEPLTSVHFSDSLTGWAGGLDGTFAKTTNGGNSWEISTTTTLWDFFDSIYSIDSLEALATVYKWGGYIIRTTNGGLDWTDEFRDFGDSRVYSVNSNDMKNFWALSSSGLIAKHSREPILLIEDKTSIISTFILQQNYPNPFNPSTKISWQSPVGGWQTLKVYDILGNEIVTLVNEYRNPGSYEIDFQSTAGSHQLANGVYFYQLRVGDYVETKKMLFLK